MAVMSAWDGVWGSTWAPRLPPNHPKCEDAKLATYQYWMSAPYLDEVQLASRAQRVPWYPSGLPHYVRVTHACNQEHLKSLIRFRCGSHSLAVETGRWSGVPRRHRVCRKCGAGYFVEDEMHVLLECSAMHALRMEYDEQLFGCIPGGGSTST